MKPDELEFGKVLPDEDTFGYRQEDVLSASSDAIDEFILGGDIKTPGVHKLVNEFYDHLEDHYDLRIRAVVNDDGYVWIAGAMDFEPTEAEEIYGSYRARFNESTATNALAAVVSETLAGMNMLSEAEKKDTGEEALEVQRIEKVSKELEEEQPESDDLSPWGIREALERPDILADEDEFGITKDQFETQVYDFIEEVIESEASISQAGERSRTWYLADTDTSSIFEAIVTIRWDSREIQEQLEVPESGFDDIVYQETRGEFHPLSATVQIIREIYW